MNYIISQLQKIKEEKRIGIMTHIVLGYPNLDESVRLIHAMIEAGVDFIELQIPFSDPLGDGPTIMKANHVALEHGITVEKSFEAMRMFSHETPIPLFFMTYYQIVFRRGVQRFCEEAAHAGATGLIIPDMPIDEESYDHFFSSAKSAGLLPMKFFSMVSTDERVRNVLEDGDFLYFFGQKGITGARSTLHEDLEKNLLRVRGIKDVPIAVGFGISKPEHVRELKAIGVDVAIIGSAVLDVFNNASQGQGVGRVKEYLTSLVEVARETAII